MTYEYHPAAQILPLMDGGKFKELANDIKEHGLLEPITMIDGVVLDGRNRLMACESVNVKPRFVEWDGSCGSPTLYVAAKNVHRRQLTIEQQAAFGVEMLPLLEEEGEKRMLAGTRPLKSTHPDTNWYQGPSGRSYKIAGSAVGVGSSTIYRAKKVKDADPEAFERLKRGESKVNTEYDKVRKTARPPRPPKPSSATPNWTAQKQAAQKRHMERGFGLLEGACTGLLGLSIEHLRAACDEDEIQTWAKQARSIAGKLCRFAKELEGNGGSK